MASAPRPTATGSNRTGRKKKGAEADSGAQGFTAGGLPPGPWDPLLPDCSGITGCVGQDVRGERYLTEHRRWGFLHSEGGTVNFN